jgi:nickel/cobalt transporter (NiCoT) family protein
MTNSAESRFRKKVVGCYTALALGNLGAWIWALVAFQDKPLLLGTAVLAYTLGLRHAVDADHIATIDNVTRKLMQAGNRPVSIGFFFSLGHSTIVIVASMIVYATAGAVGKQMDPAKEIGSFVGTSVSALFLVAIAFFNILILRRIWQTFQMVRKGGGCSDRSPEMMLGGGIIGRLCRPLFRMLSSPLHMFPIGLLFGLGFDTASEVALLGISAAGAANGLSLCTMAVFPILFTAGMTLVDTADGILMIGAYGWAFVNPIRKLYYNLTITFVSIVVALLIGGIQFTGLLREKLNLTGGWWDIVGTLDQNFGTLGLVIIGVFAFSWAGSVVIYRLKGFDRSETPSATLNS